MRFDWKKLVLTISLTSSVHAATITEGIEAVGQAIDDKLTYQVTDKPKLDKLPKDLEIAQKLHRFAGIGRVAWVLKRIFESDKDMSSLLRGGLEAIELAADTYHTDKLANSLVNGKLPTKWLLALPIFYRVKEIKDSAELYKNAVYPPDYDRLQSGLKHTIENAMKNQKAKSLKAITDSTTKMAISGLRYAFSENLEAKIANKGTNSWLSLGSNLHKLRLAYAAGSELYYMFKHYIISPTKYEMRDVSNITEVVRRLTNAYIQYRVDSLASQPAVTK